MPHPHFDNHEQSRIAAEFFVRTVYVHSISQGVGSSTRTRTQSKILVGIEMESGGHNSAHFS